MTESDKKRFYTKIGESINVARNNLGFSQEQLAKKVSMSRASIVNIEKGRQNPPIHLIWQFSKILEVTIDDLLPNFDITNEDVNDLFQKEIKNKAEVGIISIDSIKSLNSFLNKK